MSISDGQKQPKAGYVDRRFRTVYRWDWWTSTGRFHRDVRAVEVHRIGSRLLRVNVFFWDEPGPLAQMDSLAQAIRSSSKDVVGVEPIRGEGIPIPHLAVQVRFRQIIHKDFMRRAIRACELILSLCHIPISLLGVLEVDTATEVLTAEGWIPEQAAAEEVIKEILAAAALPKTTPEDPPAEWFHQGPYSVELTADAPITHHHPYMTVEDPRTVRVTDGSITASGNEIHFRVGPYDMSWSYRHIRAIRKDDGELLWASDAYRDENTLPANVVSLICNFCREGQHDMCVARMGKTMTCRCPHCRKK